MIPSEFKKLGFNEKRILKVFMEQLQDDIGKENSMMFGGGDNV